MRALRKFVLFLVVLLVVGLVAIATCPAEFAYRLFGDRLGAVKLAGISGSIWQGHASSTQVFGLELGALDWQLPMQPLLHGIAAAHVVLSGGDISATGDVQCDGDAVEIHRTNVHAPARFAAPALDIPALQLLGDIEIDVDQARLRGTWPETAQGSMHWRNAAVAGAAQAQLGDLEGTFASAGNGSIAGIVHDVGGPLQLNGTFQARAGSYDAEAKLLARDGNTQVMEALRYVGEPQADGSSLLKIHGELFKIF
jgi:hypothetical protein